MFLDGRWVRCQQALITAGGELTMEALELGYSPLQSRLSIMRPRRSLRTAGFSSSTISAGNRWPHK